MAGPRGGRGAIVHPCQLSGGGRWGWLGAGASAGREGKGASTYRVARNDGHVVGSGRAERWHQATLTGTWNLKQESPSRKDGTDKRYRVQSWLYFIGVVSGQAEVLGHRYTGGTSTDGSFVSRPCRRCQNTSLQTKLTSDRYRYRTASVTHT